MLHKKYLHQFKSAALREIESGKPITELARTLGVSKNTLYCWLQKAKRTKPSNSTPTPTVQ